MFEVYQNSETPFPPYMLRILCQNLKCVGLIVPGIFMLKKYKKKWISQFSNGIAGPSIPP